MNCSLPALLRNPRLPSFRPLPSLPYALALALPSLLTSAALWRWLL